MEMSNRGNFLKKVAVAATSAIVAPELLQAATKAESALSQTTAAQGAGNLIVPKEGGLRITGTFLDEISHDIPHQNWGAKEREADFRHMKAIGIDTVIVIRSGYRKFITYPSPYLLKQGCYMPVSYTHLDVYKRQLRVGPLGTADRRLLPDRREPLPRHGHHAVAREGHQAGAEPVRHPPRRKTGERKEGEEGVSEGTSRLGGGVASGTVPYYVSALPQGIAAGRKRMILSLIHI